jgi:catechol 2,3-dioxygenase-like lactoylglutathione lyase family enzyme
VDRWQYRSMTDPPITVQGFDHLVLRCRDVESSLRFYVDVLGLPPVRVDEWRDGAAPFPSVRISADAIIDLVAADGPIDAPNVDHFCLVTSAAVVDALAAERERYRVTEGPVPRFGARGMGTSVYLLDPDDNTVELRTYEPPAGSGA